MLHREHVLIRQQSYYIKFKPKDKKMIGAIIGDIIGSRHEFNNTRHKNFELFTSDSTFTDDTVLTIATAQSLLTNMNFEYHYRSFARAYPGRAYGIMFSKWVSSSSMGPYNSYGNGSAMRVSPVAYFSKSTDQVLKLASATALPTHNHPEGVKGAQATAMAIFLALQGRTTEDIKHYIADAFCYNMNFKLDDIREDFQFDETCQGTVPAALQAVFESISYEDAIRNAISIGGDSDTIACIAGGFAEAVWGVPDDLKLKVNEFLPPEFLKISKQFYSSIF